MIKNCEFKGSLTHQPIRSKVTFMILDNKGIRALYVRNEMTITAMMIKTSRQLLRQNVRNLSIDKHNRMQPAKLDGGRHRNISVHICGEVVDAR